MKNFLKLSILNALLFISLPAFAQEKAGEKPVTPAPTSPAVTTEATPAVVSEEKTVAKASAFSILFAKSGIVADSNFTFFAPSDEAIATAGVNLDSVSVETAVALVNAHGVKLNVASTSIVKDTTFETLAGTKITLSKSETGILVNGTVAVVSADEKTAHGL